MAGIKIDYKKVIYVLCFLFLCIIDQRVKTGTGLDGIIESFRDSIGIVIAVIILSHYDVRDINHYRVPLLIWAVIAVAAGGISFFALKSRFYYANDRAVLAINIYLYGFVCILIFAKLCIEKQRLNINKRLLVLWLLMYVCMNLSRSDLLWT